MSWLKQPAPRPELKAKEYRVDSSGYLGSYTEKWWFSKEVGGGPTTPVEVNVRYTEEGTQYFRPWEGKHDSIGWWPTLAVKGWWMRWEPPALPTAVENLQAINEDLLKGLPKGIPVKGAVTAGAWEDQEGPTGDLDTLRKEFQDRLHAGVKQELAGPVPENKPPEPKVEKEIPAYLVDEPTWWQRFKLWWGA